ncbi:Uncharacterized protein BP5553_04780 [Venustampulla echinocandica]|uniref:Mitochondrial carrier protein pet8 protein n=1 Tax=Venustampulla echinocandica TaxID=2656787 RepID=A0A370TPA0_9HELO|nr:Uncharacterized protein BP5553_04780 [Venustampulla echinocandica]RDL37347.1 Uncharacterized protein BP5553_04780 [Venustampulla echinocandica]
MSLLYRTSRFVPAALRTPVTARAFTSSSVWQLKEGDRDTSPEENEKHKQDTVRKAKEGKGHWKPELATNSEEAVKADRSAGSDSIADLQKRTVEYAEKTRK